jgi:hypothetical protein
MRARAAFCWKGAAAELQSLDVPKRHASKDVALACGRGCSGRRRGARRGGMVALVARNEPNRQALLRIHQELSVGTSAADVLRTYERHRSAGLSLYRNDDRDWYIRMPREFGATDWYLRVEFETGTVPLLASGPLMAPRPRGDLRISNWAGRLTSRCSRRAAPWRAAN